MATLRRNLAHSLGVTPSYLAGLQPRWWRDELADDPGAYFEAVVYLAKAFDLSVREVGASEGQVQREQIPFLCKGSPDEKQKRHVGAVIAARALAKLGAKACSEEFQRLPEGASTIRRDVLARAERIDLESLASYCWSIGIPVLWCGNLPSPRPHAVLFRVDRRPVVVLCRNRQHSGWLLFDLAHELGHIARKHLREDWFVDEKIDANSGEVLEAEANQFALELLMLGQDFPVIPRGSQSQFLRAWSKLYGNQWKVDSQWFLIALAWHSGAWAQAQAVLKEDFGQDSAAEKLKCLMREHLDMEALKESERELLDRLLAE
jgi:hypothetical protein